MAASVQPKDEAEREMLAQAAQSVQAKQASRKTHQMRFALWVVPLTVAALLGAVAVAAAFA